MHRFRFVRESPAPSADAASLECNYAAPYRAIPTAPARRDLYNLGKDGHRSIRYRPRSGSIKIGSLVAPEQRAIAAHRMLGGLLQGIECAGAALDDISRLDPESPNFKSLPSQAGAAWDEFEDAIFYRCTDGDLRFGFIRGTEPSKESTISNRPL